MSGRVSVPCHRPGRPGSPGLVGARIPHRAPETATCSAPALRSPTYGPRFRAGSGPAHLGSAPQLSETAAPIRICSLSAGAVLPALHGSDSRPPRRRSIPGALTSRFRTCSGPAHLGSAPQLSQSAAPIRFCSAHPVPQRPSVSAAAAPLRLPPSLPRRRRHAAQPFGRVAKQKARIPGVGESGGG